MEGRSVASTIEKDGTETVPPSAAEDSGSYNNAHL
jgi:hypothetical protein